MSAYIDREQTQAKHFILKGYLQALAYKVLRNWDVVFVDGFCGPWGSETADFSDTSFKIAPMSCSARSTPWNIPSAKPNIPICSIRILIPAP